MTEDDLKRIEAECYYIGTVYGYEYTSEPEQLVQAYRALKKENDELLTENEVRLEALANHRDGVEMAQVVAILAKAREDLQETKAQNAKLLLQLANATSDALVETHKKLDEANNEITELMNDIHEAAGELMIDAPKPGTDLAKVMIANRILRNERDDYQSRLATVKDQWRKDATEWKAQLEAEKEAHAKTAKQFADMKAYADAREIDIMAKIAEIAKLKSKRELDNENLLSQETIEIIAENKALKDELAKLLVKIARYK